MILCFDWPTLYRREYFLPAFSVACFGAIIVYHFGTNLGLAGQVVGLSAVLFLGSMVGHGELVRMRPDVNRLTQFYLAISFGSALGGVFAVVVAPHVFNRHFEFHYSLLAIAICAGLFYSMEHFRNSVCSLRPLYLMWLVSGLAMVPVLSSLYYHVDPALNPGVLFAGRNDYGLVSVFENDEYRMMQSGNTNHGGQWRKTSLKNVPFAYYSDGSGAQLAFALQRSGNAKLPMEDSNKALNVGVIGLGTGSLVSHGQVADQFRFYEVNPMVERIARSFFSYLDDSGVEVVLGDGRVELAREWSESGAQQFDLLFLDAFTSDSIPAHLLTTECFDLYLKHLRSDGVIVAHITNKFIDLQRVVTAHVRSLGLSSVLIEHQNDKMEITTRWILMSPDAGRFDGPPFTNQQRRWHQGLNPLRWTDEKSSVLPIVKWNSNNSR